MFPDARSRTTPERSIGENRDLIAFTIPSFWSELKGIFKVLRRMMIAHLADSNNGSF